MPESWLYPVTAMHTWNHSACNSSSCAWCTCAAQAHNSKSITLPVKRPSVTSIGFVTTQSSPPLYTLFQTVSNAIDRLKARGNNSGSGNNANSNVGSSSRALYNTFNRTSMLVVILSKVNGR